MEQILDDYCYNCHPESYKCGNKSPLTMSQFLKWKEHFDDEPFMVRDRDAMEKLDEDMFVRQRIEHLSFEDEIPEELNAEKYLLMYKKIWAVIRHDLFKEIQEKKRELRTEKLEAKEFDELYEEVHKRFEKIRVEVY